jgi:hypothetical protein
MSVSWLLLSAWLCGCALDPAHQDDGTEREARLYDDDIEVAVTEQAIRGGSEVPNGKRGVVQISIDGVGTCTGALIHRFYMITAAHCVKPALGAAFEGNVFGEVRYFKNSGTDTVLLHDRGAPMYAWVWPTYAGGSDTMSDFALVSSWRFGAGWPNVTNADFLPMSLGDCAQIDSSVLYGRGFNAFAGTGSGVLRSMVVNVKSCLEHHFFSLAGTAHTCRGDSGGPYLVRLANGVEAIAGLHSNSDSSSNCAEEGGRQRATRILGKTQWVETRMGAACATKNSNGHVYKQCF